MSRKANKIAAAKFANNFANIWFARGLVATREG